jgi:hypothetical protein
MRNMQRFVRQRFAEESKEWRFNAHALVTDDNMASFSGRVPVRKVPVSAEVSWRSDLGLLSAQYIVSTTLRGLVRDDVSIATAGFNVLAFESWYDGLEIVHNKLLLGRTVTNSAGFDVISVPLPNDGVTLPFVMGNADEFIHGKVARIEDAAKIAALGLIG